MPEEPVSIEKEWGLPTLPGTDVEVRPQPLTGNDLLYGHDSEVETVFLVRGTYDRVGERATQALYILEGERVVAIKFYLEDRRLEDGEWHCVYDSETDSPPDVSLQERLDAALTELEKRTSPTSRTSDHWWEDIPDIEEVGDD